MELGLEGQQQLRALGRALARGTDRYGRRVEGSEATLIRVDRLDESHARVTVVDAVGVIAIPGLQLQVEPKIPQGQLLFLAEHSGVLPRRTPESTTVREDEHLAVLIAHWFVTALERVLEEGLSRGYREDTDELDRVRGRVALLPTARLFYRGRLAVVAEYEEFDFDIPLNRLLLAAARVVASGVVLPDRLRRRAIRAIKRMDGVGEPRRSDLAALVDRATAHYADAAVLAGEVIASSGRRLESGDNRSWGFLFRTADPVEIGIRSVLKEALADQIAVSKKGFPLGNSSLYANPDLVFGDVLAVGDVKYKQGKNEWQRADLYEVVAFAAAAERAHALIVNFRPRDSPGLPPVQVGKIEVTEISWPADADVDAHDASQAFTDRVREWLAGLLASA
jgi:5-methylcytosine-specific restriction endonuclease McrBC regulatory subunit McrC